MVLMARVKIGAAGWRLQHDAQTPIEDGLLAVERPASKKMVPAEHTPTTSDSKSLQTLEQEGCGR